MLMRAFCLDCERSIELNSTAQIGQRVRCAHCHVELEIINLNPPELDWIYQRLDNQWNLLLEEE